MAFPQVVKVTVTGGRGHQGPPGGSNDTYANLAIIAISTVPSGTNLIRTDNGNSYIYDAAVDATFVAANPLTSVLDVAGRGFRLVDASYTAAGTELAGDSVGILRSGVKRLYDIGTALLARVTSAALAASGGSGLVGFIQSGTGAVLRNVLAKLRDEVSVKDYGAVGDGATDDTAAIQAAMTASLRVRFPSGNYLWAQVNLRTGQHLIGDGVGITTLTYKNNGNGYGIYGNGVSNVIIERMTIVGNSANNLTNGTGIRIEGASSNVLIEKCRIRDWRDHGVANVGTGTNFRVIDCQIVSNLIDGVVSYGPRSVVERNDLSSNGRYGCIFFLGANNSRAVLNVANGNGETGLTAVGVGGSLSDILFAHNTVNGNRQYGINCVTVSNVTYDRNFSQSNGVDGLGVTLTSPYALIINNYSSSNGRVGIAVDSNSDFSIVKGNQSLGNGWEGVAVYRSIEVTVSQNKIINNGVNAVTDPDPFDATYVHDVGIFVYDTAPSPNHIASNRTIITANTIADTGTNTQKRGLVFQDKFSNSVGSIVSNNIFYGATTSQMVFVNGNLAFARDNTGLRFEQQGSATILSGTTSIAVTFASAMSYTPTAQDITLTPTQLATTAPGELYVTAISTAGFTINCRTNPGASNLTVGWRVARSVF